VSTTRRVEIGSRLRELRIRLKLSQRYVADELGCSDKAVGAWEAGDRMPNIETLADLCLMYGSPSDYVLYGTHMVPSDLKALFGRMSGPMPEGPEP
jgi:transcriptional regulator with XRE-family HTH domain